MKTESIDVLENLTAILGTAHEAVELYEKLDKEIKDEDIYQVNFLTFIKHITTDYDLSYCADILNEVLALRVQYRYYVYNFVNEYEWDVIDLDGLQLLSEVVDDDIDEWDGLSILHGKYTVTLTDEEEDDYDYWVSRKVRVGTNTLYVYNPGTDA